MEDNEEIYSTGDSVSTNKDGDMQPRKIRPKEYKKDNIFRIYVSNTSFFSAILNELKETILEYGDSITEFLGGKFDEETLSQIAGRIDTADFVILLYNFERKIEEICKLQCKDCNLNGICRRKHAGSCRCYLSEYEYNYSISKQKPVLVFLDEKNATAGKDFFGDDDVTDKRKVVVYKTNNFDQIRQGYQEFYNDNKQSFEGLFSKKSIVTSHEDNSDKVLRVLNKCIQRGGVSQTIGEYIITSGEMYAKEDSEIHIITNELVNYDFTTMSSLTIAMNTQRGAKYYYYCTEDQNDNIGYLKERIKNFYEKSVKTRNEVVAWIRQSKFESGYFESWLTIFQGSNRKKLGDIIEYLLMLSGLGDCIGKISDECRRICKEKGMNYDVDFIPVLQNDTLKRWLSSSKEVLNKDYKTVYKFIDFLSVLIIPLEADMKVKQHRVVADFLEGLRALDNMSKLTRWQISPPDWEIELSESEINSLMDYFQYSGERLIVSEPIKNWLIPECGQSVGNLQISEEDKERWVANIHFCPIADNTPYILGYNFTIFLDHVPNCADVNLVEKSAAAAWYTTYISNESNASTDIDNSMLMINIDVNDELFHEIVDIYKNLILNNQAVREELNGSSLLKRLGIEN